MGNAVLVSTANLICMFLRHSKCYGNPNKGGVCAPKSSFWKEKLFSLLFRVHSMKELWQSSSALSEVFRRLSNIGILENSKLKYHANSWFVLSSPGVKGRGDWRGVEFPRAWLRCHPLVQLWHTGPWCLQISISCSQALCRILVSPGHISGCLQAVLRASSVPRALATVACNSLSSQCWGKAWCNCVRVMHWAG